MANPWSQWLHPSLHIHFAARTEAVHGLQRYQYFLQAAHQESFCGPPHPQVLRGSHAKATWDSEQTIGAQLFRGVFFCRSCQVYELVGMTWEESSPSGRSAGLLVSCSLFHVSGQVANQRKRVEKTLAQDTLRSGTSHVHPSIPYHPLKRQQDPTRITKYHEINVAVSAVCLPWCWAERPKKAWALHLIHINPYTVYIYIYM